MRLFEIRKCCFVFFMIAPLTLLLAQTKEVNTTKKGAVIVTQDSIIEELVSIRKKLTENDSKKRYRIQIYNGTLGGAENKKNEFTTSFGEEISCHISFETPNYKVRVGKFRTRLEADRYLIKVRDTFPSAFLLEP